MGSEYRLADPYVRVFYGWGVRSGFHMNKLSAYTTWRERMLKRPTVRKIVEAKQKISYTDVRLT